jgi:hypothetical protein
MRKARRFADPANPIGGTSAGIEREEGVALQAGSLLLGARLDFQNDPFLQGLGSDLCREVVPLSFEMGCRRQD